MNLTKKSTKIIDIENVLSFSKDTTKKKKKKKKRKNYFSGFPGYLFYD